MTAASPIFTAAELSRACGLSKKGVRSALATVPSRHAKIVRGNAADAWPLADLPETLRARIDRAAQVSGNRDVESHLAAPSVPWQPKIPLSQIADVSIDKASKLRLALARALELRDDDSITSARLEQIGLEDYKRVFGHAITTRHFRSLLKRTVDRDNFADNFNRLEIYLDERPARKPVEPSELPDCSGKFAPIHDWLARSKKPLVRLTHAERDELWREIIEHHEWLVLSGEPQKPLRRELIDYLETQANWLAKNRHALYVAFVAKLKQHREGKPIRDGRHAKKGIPTGGPISPARVKDIQSIMVFMTRCRVAPAVRMANELAPLADAGVQTEDALQAAKEFVDEFGGSPEFAAAVIAGEIPRQENQSAAALEMPEQTEGLPVARLPALADIADNELEKQTA